MKIAQLTPEISVASQPSTSDIERIAAAGFRSLINNRPDGEAPDQPESAELAEVAQRLGLEYRQMTYRGPMGEVASRFPQAPPRLRAACE